VHISFFQVDDVFKLPKPKLLTIQEIRISALVLISGFAVNGFLFQLPSSWTVKNAAQFEISYSSWITLMQKITNINSLKFQRHDSCWRWDITRARFSPSILHGKIVRARERKIHSGSLAFIFRPVRVWTLQGRPSSLWLACARPRQEQKAAALLFAARYFMEMRSCIHALLSLSFISSESAGNYERAGAAWCVAAARVCRSTNASSKSWHFLHRARAQ
jgi:hypothetical protein